MTPYDRLFTSLDGIHAEEEKDGLCVTCGTPVPCDTMRSLWIYSLSILPRVGR